MAGETRRRSAGRSVPTMPRAAAPAREAIGTASRAADRSAAGATRVAAVFAFAVLVVSGVSVHALVFWAAALFILVRFGDLEGLLRDDDERH